MQSRGASGLRSAPDGTESRPEHPRPRGSPLGRRGHARCHPAARTASRGHFGVGHRNVPRRRFRPDAPFARRPRRARDDHVRREHPTRSTVDRVGRPPRRELQIDPAKLHETTSGNPFYVREVLDAGGDVIPENVRSAVLARTSGLSQEANEVVEAVSIAPPRVDASMLGQVCGDATNSIGECIATGVLVAHGDAVAFRHELARLVIEDGLTPTRRTELHRRTLAALAASPTGERDPARLAHHAEAAGESCRSPPVRTRRAEQAFEVGAFREAAAQYARALRFASDVRRANARRSWRAAHVPVTSLTIRWKRSLSSAMPSPAEKPRPPRAAARALTGATSYLLCRGLYSRAEAAVSEAESSRLDGAQHGRVRQRAALSLALDLRRRSGRRNRARSRGRGHRARTRRSRDSSRRARHHRIPRMCARHYARARNPRGSRSGLRYVV